MEACPAKHLALHHLQAMDLAFDRSLTPRQCDCCLDGGNVLPGPFGKALEGRDGALGARMSRGSSSAGWRWRMTQAKSCVSATASASAGDCTVSRTNRWSSSSVYRSGKGRTSDVARGEQVWCIRCHHCEWLIAAALP
jgi:hypothetical protein